MADKKFKTGVDLQSTVKISSETASRALTLDGSGNIASSAVTDTELGHLSGVSSDIQTQLDAKIPSTEKGAVNGVATLDAGGKVPAAQLPNSVMEYKGSFDPATATFTDAGGNAGDVYLASAAGSYDAGSGSITYAIGDWAVHNGSVFEKSLNSNAVVSVNGSTGVVVLDADDIDDTATTHKFVTAADITKLGHITVTQAVDLDTMESDIATNTAKVSADGSVTTHNDVTSAGSGAIITVAERADIVSNTASRHDALTLGGVASDTTDDTLDLTGQVLTVNQVTTTTDGAMIAADKLKLDGIEASAKDDQSAAEVPYTNTTSGLTATDVQAAIDEVEGRVDTLEGSSHAAVTLNADDPTQQTLNLSGQEIQVNLATSSTDGAMSAEDKTKLDGISGGSAGDISETSFSAANNQVAAANVTGLAFANGTVRSFDALVSVTIDATADLYESFRLLGVQKGAGWDMAVEAVGDESNITFSITAAGQVQYTSGNEAGFVSNTMKFRASTTSV